MPKQLINTIGLVIVIAIVAVGVALVAVPLVLQSVATGVAAVGVQQLNAVKEAEVANLQEQSGNSASLDADLADLQAQIPTTPKVYTISELISDAAERTGVTVTGITPNAPVPFAMSEEESQTRADGAGGDAEAVVGQARIPVQINVLAADYEEILAFIDELRGGPRLLGDIDATISSRGGADATISAYAFADIAENGEGE